MFTDLQFSNYVSSHSLSLDAVNYLTSVRTSEPSRMVGRRARTNVVSFIPSKKMNRTISAESRGPERAFVLMSEYDERVIEIWDQPVPMATIRIKKNKRQTNNWYTPDFLILTNTGPVIVEVKSQSHVDLLCKTFPEDWVLNGSSHYDYLPAKRAFNKIGIQFYVFVYSNDLRFRINNLEVMMRSRSVQRTISIADVDKLFSESFVWTLADLKDRLGAPDYSQIVALVDDGYLIIDVDAHLLTEPKGCLIVREYCLLKEAKELFELNKFPDPLSLRAVNVAKFPNEKYAMNVMDKIRKLEAGETSRSIRRWKSLITQGKEIGLSAFQSLISKKYLSGNRRARINNVVREFLTAHIYQYHVNAQGMPARRCYVTYRVDAQDAHPQYPPVVWETYRQHVKQLPAGVLAEGRGGVRSGNRDSAPTDPKERLLKPDLSWRLAALDHYLADIYVIFYTDDGVVWVLRPWLSALIDLYSGMVIGFSMSFQPPSRRSNCKVIRDCARRHGKLPAEIITDRGSDFTSVYFASMMAHFEIEAALRPASNPKFGGEIERLFGEFKQQWLSQRKGNLADYKEARTVDGKFAPKNNAVLTPYDFYREFEMFCDWRSHKPRGASSESISNKFHESSRKFPFVGIDVQVNDEFLLATAVESKHYTIDFNRGIHIGELFYSNPKLNSLKGKKAKVEVRLDPENPHVVYALVNSHWEVCRTSHAGRFSAMDSISQRCEMLKIVESKSSKSIIAQMADEDLVKKIRTMDLISSNNPNTSALLELPSTEDQESGEFLIAALNTATITPLSAESW